MSSAALLLVPFREVRHDQPDDCLHYEPLALRARAMAWVIPPHRHEGLHQFLFLESGSMRGTVDGTTLEARAPALLLLAPGSVHGFHFRPETQGHQLTIPSTTLKAVLAQTRFMADELAHSSLQTRLPKASSQEIRHLFQQIAKEFHSLQPGRVQALLACATLLAVACVRSGVRPLARPELPGARDALARRYLALVEEHFRSAQTLNDYAKQLGVTVDHLSRACRQVMSQSALELLHERRLLEARRLLAYSQLPIAHIAHQLGYDDPAYFSRFFQRRVGVPPSGYRAQVADGLH